MDLDALVTVLVAFAGMAISWGVWVSVSVFKHQQEIALIKQEIKLLLEVKEVLENIKLELRIQNKNDD